MPLTVTHFPVATVSAGKCTEWHPPGYCITVPTVALQVRASILKPELKSFSHLPAGASNGFERRPGGPPPTVYQAKSEKKTF
jgi:hypothetical protein